MRRHCKYWLFLSLSLSLSLSLFLSIIYTFPSFPFFLSAFKSARNRGCRARFKSIWRHKSSNRQHWQHSAVHSKPVSLAASPAISGCQYGHQAPGKPHLSSVHPKNPNIWAHKPWSHTDMYRIEASMSFIKQLDTTRRTRDQWKHSSDGVGHKSAGTEICSSKKNVPDVPIIYPQYTLKSLKSQTAPLLQGSPSSQPPASTSWYPKPLWEHELRYTLWPVNSVVGRLGTSYPKAKSDLL